MGINLVIAVTDGDWFEMVRREPVLGAVNFRVPSAANFRDLQPSELFLFKLHAPCNVIVVGIFAYATALPCSFVWEAFGEANGARSAQEMHASVAKYRPAGITMPCTVSGSAHPKTPRSAPTPML